MEQQCPILLLSKTTYNLFDHCMAVYNTSSNININQAPVHVIPGSGLWCNSTGPQIKYMFIKLIYILNN